ncbi:MAG: HAMP domain-containing histidine kinase [Planctomycetes bacterium]|nr:HAMP domain-containing histidine kinase [Planctomycetota bacterium]
MSTPTPSGEPPAESLPAPRRGTSIREFLSALGDRVTYTPTRNSYAIFGFLWGLPIPVFSIGLHCWLARHPPELSMLWEHPVHLIFLAHPLLFAVVFGAMGTVRIRKNAEIRRLVGELERHVAELAEANDKLKELDRMKSQFMANVTHELKTPLVAIRGYNESILEGRFGPLSEKQRDGLTVAVRNIDRLQRLIEELLEFERIDAGAFRPEPTDFDLVPLIRGTLQNFQPQIEEKGLVPEPRLPEMLFVRADREKIGRVLLNLLSNAVKFSEKQSAIGIDATRDENKGLAEVAVWDRGIGIPDAVQKYLFTRFWQADGSSRRRHGGTGLGLAICKGILDAHGASLRIESTEGRGTCAVFSLPLAGRERMSEGPGHDQRKTADSRR